MKLKVCSIVFPLILVLSLTACGVPAQPTAIAPVVEPTTVPPTATPIPEPTSTSEPTLVPIDLTIQIQDMKGKPLQATNLQINDKPQVYQSNEKGEINLTGLDVDKVKLVANTPGYKRGEKQAELKRGANTLVIQLEEDPFGLKLTDACAPGEKPLYVEDFQNQQAINWPEIDAEAMGWSVGVKPDEPGNYMAMAKGSKEIIPPPSDLKSDLKFDNAVWRVKVWFSGKLTNSIFLNWRHSFEDGDMRYFTHLGPQVLFEMIRFNSGEGITVGRAGSKMPLNKWTYFEFSTFDGTTQLWMNGKKMIEYKDKKPLPPGTIGLEPHFSADGEIFIDNMAVCELNAPFVSLVLPATPKK